MLNSCVKVIMASLIRGKWDFHRLVRRRDCPLLIRSRMVGTGKIFEAVKAWKNSARARFRLPEKNAEWVLDSHGTIGARMK